MESRPVDMTRSCPSPASSGPETIAEDSTRGPPITINELVQLSHIGIPNDQVTWNRVTMTSDKWIAVRHDNRTDLSARRAVVTVLSPIEGTISYAGSTSADSVLMNPSQALIALKAGLRFEVFNLDSKELVNKVKFHDVVVHWTWLSTDVIAMVTDTAVYHWNINIRKTENEKDLQQLLDIVKEESEKKGLELNRKKTEVMVVSRKQELPIINIYIKGTRLKQKDQFKYLGSLISSDGRNNSEVASRIAQAKTNFQKMKTVLTNKNISIQTRRRALECYIEPILMYGCEAWTISKQTQRKLEATEMWFLRRMLRISWTAKKTNDTVLEEAHTTRLLISKIRKRQATFFGHVMRREKLVNLVTTGMLEGKRSNLPPQQVFVRHHRLAFTEIVSYKADPTLNWLALTGLTPEDNRISGVTQLYNKDEELTQCINAHACCFSTYHFPGNPWPSTVFCVGSREVQDHGKVHVIELGPYKTGNYALRNSYDHLHFLDDLERYDFPISVEISVDYGLLFVVTKYGYLYICDMETAMCLCCTRVAVDVTFAAVLNTNTQGLLAITRGGQVITVDIKKDGFISYLREQVRTAYRANKFEKVICQ
ncbi:clathrin heavy chain 1 [Plakobranchus ocellatus]|uniref:Clathrin heavy chain 1 n=1 Tax=Plakobranchus ocellatus TaxID=259542 RepID=A0AAV4CE96_9GAST|nr:clathrin heavy chain 1 [Plakobranchus ocellatus]